MDIFNNYNFVNRVTAGSVIYGQCMSLSSVGESFANGPLYQSFSTLPGTSLLVSAEFFFLPTGASALTGVTANLLADSSGHPGAVVASLGSFPSLTFVNGAFSCGLPINQVVNPNTRYWVQLIGPGSQASWAATTQQGLFSASEFWTDGTGVIHSTTAGHGGFQVAISDSTSGDPIAYTF